MMQTELAKYGKDAIIPSIIHRSSGVNNPFKRLSKPQIATLCTYAIGGVERDADEFGETRLPELSDDMYHMPQVCRNAKTASIA